MRPAVMPLVSRFGSCRGLVPKRDMLHELFGPNANSIGQQVIKSESAVKIDAYQ
jgi:hypothetical protein